ncbi:hypothetical protein Plhal304r1_c024g0082421 [Plasmopara halstedii]
MDIVALNERLRDDFSVLLKLLPPPFAVSAFSTIESSVDSTPKSSPSELSIDNYTQHCRLMLWRLNSYQYGSASAFLLDLEQLERAADSLKAKEAVQRLLDRLTVSEGENEGKERVVKVANKAGTSVILSSCDGVPGIQKVISTERGTENESMWRCNLSVREQIVTIGTFNSQKEALVGYEKQRKEMSMNTTSFNKLMHRAAKMESEQREANHRVLKEALAQCHPRLTTMKASPAPVTSNVTPRFTARSVTKPLAAAAQSSPVNVKSTKSAASPPRTSRVLKRQNLEIISAIKTKKQKVELQAMSTLSTGSRSFLRLRRLIQTRMCKHLKGQDVCVLANPNILHQANWIASGRLEAGKVFSLDKKKQMTFADYVYSELGYAVSACAHMFLVQTKESIDDHLKVCDAFSDKERELGPTVDVKTSDRRR